MVEKSPLGILEILLHMVGGVICLGVLVTSAVVVNKTNDIFDYAKENDGVTPEFKHDRDRYRGVAAYLLAVGIAGIILDGIMVMTRGLYFIEMIKIPYIRLGLFGIIFSVSFALLLLAGAAESSANAVNLKDDILDYTKEGCDSVDNNPDYPETKPFKEFCDNLIILRNSQAASAALGYLGAMVFGAMTMVIVASILTKRSDSAYEELKS